MASDERVPLLSETPDNNNSEEDMVVEAVIHKGVSFKDQEVELVQPKGRMWSKPGPHPPFQKVDFHPEDWVGKVEPYQETKPEVTIDEVTSPEISVESETLQGPVIHEVKIQLEDSDEVETQQEVTIDTKPEVTIEEVPDEGDTMDSSPTVIEIDEIGPDAEAVNSKAEVKETLAQTKQVEVTAEYIIEKFKLHTVSEPDEKVWPRLNKTHNDEKKTRAVIESLFTWKDIAFRRALTAPTNIIEKTVPWLTDYRISVESDPDFDLKMFSASLTSRRFELEQEWMALYALAPMPVLTSVMFVTLTSNKDFRDPNLLGCAVGEALPAVTVMASYLSALRKYHDAGKFDSVAHVKKIWEIFRRYQEKWKTLLTAKGKYLGEKWRNGFKDMPKKNAPPSVCLKYAKKHEKLVSETRSLFLETMQILCKYTYHAILVTEWALLGVIGVPKHLWNVMTTRSGIPEMRHASPILNAQMSLVSDAFGQLMDRCFTEKIVLVTNNKNIEEITDGRLAIFYTFFEPFMEFWYISNAVSKETSVRDHLYLAGMTNYVDPELLM